MHRHIIVSGDDALATTIADELKNAGVTVVRLANTDTPRPASLASSPSPSVAHALAVVCAGDDDATNLEIALLARKANPNVRVVARVANDVLREAVADDNGPGAILDVAELAAPSVVEACLAHATHQFEAAGIEFVVSGREASRDATLRELYGDLAPVAVIHGENSPTPGEMEVCPGRDQRVHAGDWTMMIGTADEVAAQGIRIPALDPDAVAPAAAAASGRRRPGLASTTSTRRFTRCVAAALLLLIGSTVLLRFDYEAPPRMGWVDALYFTIETMTTTGYGDFSFVHQPTWLRVFAAAVDVQRGDHHRVAGRVRRRRAAVAPLRHGGRTPAGAPSAQPHRRRRAERARDPRGQRSDRRRIRRGGDRARRGEPILVGGARTRRAGDLRRRHLAPDPGIGAGGSRPRGGGADPRRHDQHRNRHRAGRDAGHRGAARAPLDRCSAGAAGL